MPILIRAHELARSLLHAQIKLLAAQIEQLLGQLGGVLLS
jgi:hypothetical protein